MCTSVRGWVWKCLRVCVLDALLLEFLKNCIFRPAVLTETLSWLFLISTNFGAFIQYLAECNNQSVSQSVSQVPVSTAGNHPTFFRNSNRRGWMNFQNIFWRLESIHQRTVIPILYEFCLLVLTFIV